MTKRSIVYIDGFNLYYGALKGTPHRWLDLQKYFEKLRQDDEIKKIWYFTAKVTGSPSQRQQIYLDALATSPLVEVVFGLYKRKTLRCKVKECQYQGNKEYKVPEEKKTDVNIALQMLDDAYQGACDRMILVSGDSDLVPAVNFVKKRYPQIEVIVYIPATNRKRGAATELRDAADKDKTLPLKLLSKAQFPEIITLASGQKISKPDTWI
ncbi:NYN domain-containing protein [Spirulina sp. CCNP1310]|uniref:NYN domain-containing protein n=1 Tax=Spirulina sp. CCNP1310 TaxID=3110249 RepID=UPI002B217AC1|nr:NYN domain-containing protein [Spirulina sp. CCNP1310]MEA5420156.1 NYN domain-containing protein [Spirulina sp. CCNP1310]